MGQYHEIFCFWCFSRISFPPAPEYPIRTVSNFFRKFAEIFTSQSEPPVSTTPVANLPPVSTTWAANLPPVTMTPAANFATSFASVVDTGGKFASGVNDIGDKFAARWQLTPLTHLPLVSMTSVANKGNNIWLLRP
jgi:hypothetical protein